MLIRNRSPASSPNHSLNSLKCSISMATMLNLAPRFSRRNCSALSRNGPYRYNPIMESFSSSLLPPLSKTAVSCFFC